MQVTAFVYVSVKAFDMFKEGDANFHLSDHLYNLLQMINGAEAPSLDALASRPSAEAEDPSAKVNPEDLDTLFSGVLAQTTSTTQRMDRTRTHQSTSCSI